MLSRHVPWRNCGFDEQETEGKRQNGGLTVMGVPTILHFGVVNHLR